MIDAFSIAFLLLFGVVAGLALGAGNYGGILGAILPGLIGGLVLSIPFLRDQLWASSAMLTAAVIVGSVACIYVPDSNGFKRFCRFEQTDLQVHIGSYHLGKSEPTDKK